MTDRPLSDDMRKEVFRAIVKEQDRGGDPNTARGRAAKRFGVTERRRAIESEGLAASRRGLTGCRVADK